MSASTIVLFSVVIKILVSAMFKIFGGKHNSYAWYILVVFTTCLVVNFAIIKGDGNDMISLFLFSLGIDNMEAFQHKDYSDMQEELNKE